MKDLHLIKWESEGTIAWSIHSAQEHQNLVSKIAHVSSNIKHRLKEVVEDTQRKFTRAPPTLFQGADQQSG